MAGTPDPGPLTPGADVSQPRRVALVGPGRAGLTVTDALRDAGWSVVGVAGRGPDAPSTVAAAQRYGVRPGGLAEAVESADLVVLAPPDAAIAATVAALRDQVRPEQLVVHLSGAVGLAVLDALPCRTGTLHPLQSLPTPGLGRARIVGAAAAIAGDAEVGVIARTIGLVPFPVRDDERVAYHAAACIASNHLVALLAQVEACTDVPLAEFLPLVRATVDNVEILGPAAALTGPVARGDVATVRAHLAAIPEAERPTYRALMRRAAVLAGRAEEFGEIPA